MAQSELSSLIGLRDSGGDRLLLIRQTRPNGMRSYILRVGTGRVLMTAGDLDRLSSVIQSELDSRSGVRLLAQAIGLLIICALAWLLTATATGPLFAYPWSN
ncbi:hypothetical protein [Mycobacterium sp.]|uniref:hypothetical protein n=1 Tax=Mycobacterium sp. TaxID=1785 RepID=UPI0025EBD197|nr:hypothetical protein [Mycobacterium sp.]